LLLLLLFRPTDTPKLIDGSLELALNLIIGGANLDQQTDLVVAAPIKVS
jgi:hypothetical protein